MTALTEQTSEWEHVVDYCFEEFLNMSEKISHIDARINERPSVLDKSKIADFLLWEFSQRIKKVNDDC